MDGDSVVTADIIVIDTQMSDEEYGIDKAGTIRSIRVL